MRISDWSSDVCSSDLRIGGEGVTVGGGGEAPHRSLVAVGELGLALHRFAVGEVGDGIVAVDGEAVLAEHRVDGEGGAGGEKAGAEKARAEDANGKTARHRDDGEMEIGRASCREGGGKIV